MFCISCNNEISMHLGQNNAFTERLKVFIGPLMTELGVSRISRNLISNLLPLFLSGNNFISNNNNNKENNKKISIFPDTQNSGGQGAEQLDLIKSAFHSRLN